MCNDRNQEVLWHIPRDSCSQVPSSCNQNTYSLHYSGRSGSFQAVHSVFQRKRGVKEYLTYLKLVQYTFIYIAIHLANVCSLSGKLLFPLPLGGLEKQSFLPLGSSGRAFTSQKQIFHLLYVVFIQLYRFKDQVYSIYKKVLKTTFFVDLLIRDLQKALTHIISTYYRAVETE